MGFLPLGGFVFSIDGGTYVGTKKAITNQTFEQIAEVLRIPKADREHLMRHNPRSVFVYRGTPEKLAPFDAAAGREGSGGGGSGS